MKYLQYIIYGAIVGRWLLGVRGRLSTCKVQGRYAVVCAHISKDEYILVGSTMDNGKAKDVTRFVEENTMLYIPVCYDLLDPDDREEFGSRLYCSHIEKEDEYWIRKASSML